MLNLKMKMCKKYSNCWYELSVIGEIFFIIMWRYKFNWSMNYLWIKYLIYIWLKIVNMCLEVSEEVLKWCIYLIIEIYVYYIWYDVFNDIFKMIN